MSSGQSSYAVLTIRTLRTTTVAALSGSFVPCGGRGALLSRSYRNSGSGSSHGQHGDCDSVDTAQFGDKAGAL